MVRPVLLILAISPLVLGCAPTPLSEAAAEARCKEEAKLADGVAGRVKVGVGSGGATGGVGITITDRVFNPQSVDDFMAECIAEKTGRAPVKSRSGSHIGAKT